MLNEFEFTVEIERKDNYDFLIRDCATPEARIVAVGEMKRWAAATGEAELPGIVSNIGKVKRAAYPGFILMTTAFPAGSLAKQLEWLCPRLGISADCVLHHTFESYYLGPSDAVEFSLLGFMASDSTLG